MNYLDYDKAGKDHHLHDRRNEYLIFPDIAYKLNLPGASSILDIGCGCSIPAIELARYAEQTGKLVVMNDAPNVLAELSYTSAKLIPGFFPDESYSKIQSISQDYDAIIIYSVLHCLEKEQRLPFLLKAASLLSKGGRMLVGDIPNDSKKYRFLITKPKFMRKLPNPDNGINDYEILNGYAYQLRAAGYDAYLLSQPDALHFCNSREDMLVVRTDWLNTKIRQVV